MLPETLCQTEEFSCMGCCGHGYTGEADVGEQILKNTEEFSNIKTYKGLWNFSKKAEKLSKCGVCKAVVNDGGRLLCSLHPTRHDGVDFRDRICDKDFFCGAMKKWQIWDDETKEKFLQFLRDKDPSWYEYSLKMDQDQYIKEFEKRPSESSQ